MPVQCAVPEEIATGGRWSMVRLLIADDHRVVREGLRLVLTLDPELEVVGEAGDGEEAVRLAREVRPDLVLMDLQMPVLDGIAATESIRREVPETEVLVLTSVLEDVSVLGAIHAGAIGYVHKDTDGTELRRAVKAAAAGQVQLSPAATQWLLQEMRGDQTAEASRTAPSLTERELEVLQLLAQGFSNADVSRALGVGDNTVKTHVRNVLAKLGVHSRTQAVLQAQRLGIVPRAGAEGG